MRALIITTIVLAVQLSMAGVSDFDKLISDSNQARRDLQQEVKKNVDALDQRETKAEVVKEDKIIEIKSENVAVTTSSLDKPTNVKAKETKKIDREQLKRVSEEIEAAKGF